MVKYLKDFILKIFGDNQPSGGSNQQPFGGGQPSGNQPSGGGGGPSGGPSWPQTPQDSYKKKTCPSCGSTEEGQWNCLKSFYEKATLRAKELENEKWHKRNHTPRYLRKGSHIQNKVDDPNLNFTKHEIESFMDLVNSSPKMEGNKMILKKSGLDKNGKYPAAFWNNLAEKAKSVGKETVLYQRQRKKFRILSNENLYEVMRKLKIW